MENISRIEEVHNVAAQNCTEGCNGSWLQCTLEVVTLNGIQPATFAGYIPELLVKGRGKFRNIMIYGPSNCAKTSMLRPLKSIFQDRLFDNPANDKYAWVGADEAEVILLQDFRFSKEAIAWNDLLLLLEGETVKPPAPKNHFLKDVIINTDVPVFATTKAPIVYRGPCNMEDEQETELMTSRWRKSNSNMCLKRNGKKM